jgi:hypothetical protein
MGPGFDGVPFPPIIILGNHPVLSKEEMMPSQNGIRVFANGRPEKMIAARRGYWTLFTIRSPADLKIIQQAVKRPRASYNNWIYIILRQNCTVRIAWNRISEHLDLNIFWWRTPDLPHGYLGLNLRSVHCPTPLTKFLGGPLPAKKSSGWSHHGAGSHASNQNMYLIFNQVFFHKWWIGEYCTNEHESFSVWNRLPDIITSS